MPGRKSSPNDFESRYFDLIQDGFNRLEGKVDANTKLTEATHEQAQRTNGRVDKLEKEVFGKIKPQDLPEWWRDPKIISILFNVSLVILVLVVAATKVDVADLLP